MEPKLKRGKRERVDYRAWQFTLFNYTKEDEERLKKLTEVRYGRYGYEICPSTNRPHLQGLLYFHTTKTPSAIKKLAEREDIHIEVQKWELGNNYEYTGKDDDIVQWGDIPKSQLAKGEAEKDRWKKARTSAREMKYDEIDDDIALRYTSNCEKLSKWPWCKPVLPLRNQLINIWIHGKTGMGKSDLADALVQHLNKSVYEVQDYDNSAFQEYTNEDIVILQDFDTRDDHYIRKMKLLTDWRPFRARIMYGVRSIRPQIVIVTSNFTPGEIWFGNADLGPVVRRFLVYEQKEPFNFEPLPSSHSILQYIQSLPLNRQLPK